LLTTAHWGYFEFRIGEFDNRKVAGDRHGKLQGHLMELVSGVKFLFEQAVLCYRKLSQ